MKAVEREYPHNPKGLVYQEFYAVLHGYRKGNLSFHKETDTYHCMVLMVTGERFYNGSCNWDCYGIVEDTPENRELVAELIDELRAAETGRKLSANRPDIADSIGTTFWKIAADFWARHGKEYDKVFTCLDDVLKSMALAAGLDLEDRPLGVESIWQVREELMLPEPLPPWRVVKAEDFRKKPRKPGAGRKPVAPGGVKPVTVTLSDADKAALKGIDKNMSEAVRKLIAQNAADAE